MKLIAQETEYIQTESKSLALLERFNEYLVILLTIFRFGQCAKMLTIFCAVPVTYWADYLFQAAFV